MILNLMRFKNESYLPGLDFKRGSVSHGGDLSKGKRKVRRPVDPKQALHLVLRSSKARGENSMLHPKHCKHIHEFTHSVGKRLGIRIYRYANVGNHIHLLIKVPSRAIWRRFLRELAGGIPIIVTGAKKGAGLKRNEGSIRGFWDGLAFTRIVRFGRDFKTLCNYIVKNLFEAAGIPMKKLLAQGLQIITIQEDGIYIGAPP
jgi:REP element-mobilizing transposase RayT